MLKNKLWFGIILSIILLVFSVDGFALYYKYTQESGANFYVGTADKADALEDTNEMRQIIDDLGALLVHSKRDGVYPKGGDFGGTIQIPETGLKFSNNPVNDDIAAYIAGEMAWQTKAELGIDLSLYYLKTEMDEFSELQAIVADKTLVNTTNKLNVFAAITSAELAEIISNETGSGLLVYGTSPNITTPTGIVKGDVGLGNIENLKVKLDAIAAPGVGNDNTEGYAVGSRWIDITNDKEYVALDVSTGAAIWTETTGAGGGTYLDLTDTPATYDNGKYAKSTADGVVWDTPAGGYTNLTSFVDQTAWRLFYSNNLGDVIELALGTDGEYLKSTGATSAPIFDTPAGAGDMLKATYDTDEDSDIDVAAGGTEKSIWTLYCIPYLSGTTAFGEIPIGTAEYALTVNAGANGYDWTLFLEDLIDDTTPEYGGPMDHNNQRDTEVKSVEFNALYDNGNSGATPTINWQNGNYQKIAVSENTLFTFSNAFIGTITLQITFSGAYTAGFNAGYTILEEGGIEISFTETLNAVDILKVMYLGTANNYVVGVMLDVKD